MPFDGSGTFSVVYTYGSEAQPIAIGKLDTELTGIATGLSTAILRNGNGKPTADIDWNAKKITNLDDSATRTGVPATKQVQDNSLCVVGSVAGTDTITGSLTPAVTAYAAGQFIVFEPANTNTAAATINLNSVGAAPLKKWDGDALAAGDLVANVPAFAVYDGTNFVVLNPQAGASGLAEDAQLGYRNVPQNAQSGNYTCVLADSGKSIVHASGAGAGDTYTIPANASVAYPAGTVLTFVNDDSNSVSIAITSDTLTLAGTTTTGTRTLAQNGVATAFKVTSTKWLIAGTGLS